MCSMPKTPRNDLFPLLVVLAFSFLCPRGTAQEVPSRPVPLASYLSQLETDFEVKFSYVDEDLEGLEVTIPANTPFKEVLDGIVEQTQLHIEKLSDRYYAIQNPPTLQICAIVLDNFERNTVPGATIEVLGNDKGTVTLDDGSFVLEAVPRGSIIRIRHLGYKPLFISAEKLLRSQPCTTLLLPLNYQPLDEVVVTQFLTTGLTRQVDGSVEIDPGAFGILPGLTEPDVLQAVQALPGIKSVDETVSDINIRGGTNDQNLILWDGIKMYQSGHFFGLISAFNPNLTEKVRLVKNGSPARYGDGVSGILDMRTKNETESQVTGGGGFNLISADAFARIPITRDLTVQVAARRALTDFFDTPTYDRFFDRVFQDSDIRGHGLSENMERHADFYFYDLAGKVLYDINENQKLRINVLDIKNRLDYREIPNDSIGDTHSNLSQSSLSLGGSLESQWTDDFTTDLNVYYTTYTLDSRNAIDDEAQVLAQGNQVVETAASLDTGYRLGEALYWHNGAMASETGIRNGTQVSNPPYFSNIKSILRTQAVYSEIDYGNPDSKLKARGGLRLNRYDNPTTFQSLVLEPRINASFELAGNLWAEIQGEMKSQALNQVIDLEQHFLGIEKRRWIVSDNDSLPLTKSRQASLGLHYEKGRLYAGLEGFYKKVLGISTRTQGFQNKDQFHGEKGSYDVSGIEFLINYKTNHYSIWVSYAYNLNNYTFDDIVPSRFPNNLDVRHTATFAGTYTWDRLKLGLGLNYHSGKPYTRPQETDPVDSSVFPHRIRYGRPNASRLPEYLRLDASAIYDFTLSRKTKASVGASVTNLNDRTNILNRYYRLDANDEIQTISRTSLGLTPNISFRISF